MAYETQKQLIQQIFGEMGAAGSTAQAQQYLTAHLDDMASRIASGSTSPESLWNEFRYSPYFAKPINLDGKTYLQPVPVSELRASPYFNPANAETTQIVSSEPGAQPMTVLKEQLPLYQQAYGGALRINGVDTTFGYKQVGDTSSGQRILNSQMASNYMPGGSTVGASGQSGNGQLPESANKVLDILQEHITNGIINPDVKVDSNLIDSYLKQAKEEMAPYYKQLFDQANQDLQTGFRQIGEDLASNERSLEKSYGQELQSTQESLARRGLTSSTIRSDAEKSLVDSTQAAIEAGRRQAERQAMSLGTAGERQVGSANLSKLPGINEAPKPILNQPGIYSFAKPTTTRDLFNPVGSTTGTLEQDRLAAEQKRKLELTNNEREFRSINTI